MLQGQLSYLEFQQAVHLFVDWWRQVCPLQHQLSWTIQKVLFPVTEQEVEYAHLERIIAPTAERAAAAAEGLAVATGEITPSFLRNAVDTAAATCSVCAAAACTAGMGSANRTVSTNPAVSYAAGAACRAADSTEDNSSFDDVTDLGDDLYGDGSVALDWEATAQQQQQCVHVHQCSVVWHDVYQVPVLYIRAFKPDGMLLSLQELLQDLPALQQYKDADQADWTFITPTDHPLLRTPCFMLHPCQTAARMQLMMQCAADSAAAAGPDAWISSAADGAAATTTAAAECGALTGTEILVKPQDDSAVWSSTEPQAAAAAAAAAAAVSICSIQHTKGSAELAQRDVAQQQQTGGAPSSSNSSSSSSELLLLYMKAWFSMVAGLLQIDLLPAARTEFFVAGET